MLHWRSIQSFLLKVLFKINGMILLRSKASTSGNFGLTFFQFQLHFMFLDKPENLTNKKDVCGLVGPQ
jgi:hypothetical protein